MRNKIQTYKRKKKKKTKSIFKPIKYARCQMLDWAEPCPVFFVAQNVSSLPYLEGGSMQGGRLGGRGSGLSNICTAPAR